MAKRNEKASARFKRWSTQAEHYMRTLAEEMFEDGCSWREFSTVVEEVCGIGREPLDEIMNDVWDLEEGDLDPTKD